MIPNILQILRRTFMLVLICVAFHRQILDDDIPTSRIRFLSFIQTKKPIYVYMLISQKTFFVLSLSLLKEYKDGWRFRLQFVLPIRQRRIINGCQKKLDVFERTIWYMAWSLMSPAYYNNCLYFTLNALSSNRSSNDCPCIQSVLYLNHKAP